MSEENKLTTNDEQEKVFEILFKQLITYYNYHRKFDRILKEGSPFNEPNSSVNENKISVSVLSNSSIKSNIEENKYIQNSFCLIDKNWINEWKKRIGYIKIIQKINRNKIKNTDYETVKEIIKQNSEGYFHIPIDIYTKYNTIYKDNKLDIFSNFDIIYKKWIKEFYPEMQKNPLFMKCYPVKFSKYKYVIMLNYQIFKIVFKETNLNIYFELIIQFIQENKGKAKIIEEFESGDINDWINKKGFKIRSDFEKNIEEQNCKFIIFNKTLKTKKEFSDNILRYSLYPQNSTFIKLYNKDSKISVKNQSLVHNQSIANLDMQKKIEQSYDESYKKENNENAKEQENCFQKEKNVDNTKITPLNYNNDNNVKQLSNKDNNVYEDNNAPNKIKQLENNNNEDNKKDNINSDENINNNILINNTNINSKNDNNNKYDSNIKNNIANDNLNINNNINDKMNNNDNNNMNDNINANSNKNINNNNLENNNMNNNITNNNIDEGEFIYENKGEETKIILKNSLFNQDSNEKQEISLTNEDTKMIT